jgi:mannose-6-phosphate isomerase-like protein (cupin superfamily)
MNVVRAIPDESVSVKLSVRRLDKALGVSSVRAHVYTLAEGGMSKHMQREEEEIYLVLEGTAMIEVDLQRLKVGEQEAAAVPARAWHRIANVGWGPLTFFVVAAPRSGRAAEVDG